MTFMIIHINPHYCFFQGGGVRSHVSHCVARRTGSTVTRPVPTPLKAIFGTGAVFAAKVTTQAPNHLPLFYNLSICSANFGWLLNRKTRCKVVMCLCFVSQDTDIMNSV